MAEENKSQQVPIELLRAKLIIRAWVTSICMLGFYALLAMLFFITPPDGNSQMLNYGVGVAGTLITGVVSFWIASTIGSSEKTELMAKMGKGV